MNRKKLGIVALILGLLVMSSMTVMALEDEAETVGEVMDESPHMRYGKLSSALGIIDYFMDKYDLTEESSIGDLISALNTDRDEVTAETMEHYDVETEEELKEAMQSERIDRIRDTLGLGDDLTDEEVLDTAKSEKVSMMKDLLGLSEDATEDEVHEAMQEWKQTNKVLLPNKGARGFFGRVAFWR
jgi:hypothetical protein